AATNGIAGSGTGAPGSTVATGNFSTAFTPVQGADGATVSYALSITGGNGTPSGLIDSQTGQADVLVQSGNTIEGHVGSASGALAFTISVDPATAIVTFTDDGAVGQPTAPNPDTSEPASLTAGVVNLVATITDKDGDFNTASLDLGTRLSILDDGPVNFTPAAIAAADNLQDKTVSGGESVTKDLTDNAVTTTPITGLAGADSFNTLAFSGTNGTNGQHLTGTIGGGATQNLTTLNGDAIFLFHSPTGNVLTATTDQLGTGLPGGASGTVDTTKEVFTLTLVPASDQYTFDLLQAIGNGQVINFTDFSHVPSGQNQWIALPQTAKNPPTFAPGQNVVFTGLTPGVDTVNTSQTGIGSNNQAVTPGEAIRADFVNNVSGSDEKHLSTLSYQGHYDVNNSGFLISQTTPNASQVDVRVDAFEVDPNHNATSGIVSGTPQQAEQITSVTVKNTPTGAVKATFSDATDDTSTDITADFAPTGDSNGVDLKGLTAGETVIVGAANPYDQLLAKNVGNLYNNTDSFDYGGATISTFNAGQPVDMAFGLSLSDKDLDTSSGTINVHLVPPTSSVSQLVQAMAAPLGAGAGTGMTAAVQPSAAEALSNHQQMLAASHG